MRAGTTLIFFDRVLQPHVVAEFGEYPRDAQIGAIDAPEFVLAGGCKKLTYGDYATPAQQIVSRDMLDAYEYTDRTARVTDCASEGM